MEQAVEDGAGVKVSGWGRTRDEREVWSESWAKKRGRKGVKEWKWGNGGGWSYKLQSVIILWYFCLSVFARQHTIKLRDDRQIHFGSSVHKSPARMTNHDPADRGRSTTESRNAWNEVDGAGMMGETALKKGREGKGRDKAWTPCEQPLASLFWPCGVEAEELVVLGVWA